MLILPLLAISDLPITVERARDRVTVDNGRVRLSIDNRRGTYDLQFAKGPKLANLKSIVRLDTGEQVETDGYTSHRVDQRDVTAVRDNLGKGLKIIVHHRGKGPTIEQAFWIYENRREAIIRVRAVSQEVVGSNYLVPIATTNPIRLDHAASLQSLHVPYDNDAYARYRTDSWATDKDPHFSREVGAVYNDTSRNGLVVGSLDHDTWKSGIQFRRGGDGQIAISAIAGVADQASRDKESHGIVRGKQIASPRMAIGWYSDWREGMERYGDLIAKISPPLVWDHPIPFGWNSWAGHKSKLNAEDARAATDFVANDIPTFRNGGTAYINLDSYWDNLKKDQIEAFVKHAHSLGLKAGIYWTPFVAWGDLDYPIGKYMYRDLALKDHNGNPLPRLDGGWPLDPTHPETLARIDRELAKYVKQGFDYVKFDFLSHGALEGRHHNPAVQTGTAAYNLGMKRILEDLDPKKVGRPFFISLSIAPLFPGGYGHSRRISCDAFANIGSTEYLLNSATYGWWTNRRLYQYNDPDSACVYMHSGEFPVTEAEGRTRFTASVISGGMMFQGDDLTLPNAKARAAKLFSNQEVLSLARRALAFRPFEGNTIDKAGDTFTWLAPDGKEAYVALFNYEQKMPREISLDLKRLGLDKSTWKVHDMWTRADQEITDHLTWSLPPMECALLRLKKR